MVLSEKEIGRGRLLMLLKALRPRVWPGMHLGQGRDPAISPQPLSLDVPPVDEAHGVGLPDPGVG